MIDCVTVYVTCDFLQLNFVSNFMPQVSPQPLSHHIAVVFSFKYQERVWCIWSVQTPGSTCIIKDRSLTTFLII